MFVSTYDSVYILDYGTDHVVRLISSVSGSKAFSTPHFKVSVDY